VTEITTADFETIKLERADRVAVLTLNRPEPLNALNAQFMNETVAMYDFGAISLTSAPAANAFGEPVITIAQTPASCSQ